MLASLVTIPIVFVHGLLSGLVADGHSVAVFLADADISPELLDESGSRVTYEQFLALYKSLTERLDDELLGFLSRPLKRGSYALMLRSAISADTLEEGMRRYASTFRLLQDDLLLEIARDGELAGFILRFVKPSIEQRIGLHEHILRTIWRTLAWLIAGKIKVARFDFAFEMPTYASSYSKVFPAALRFDQESSGFWFNAALLAKPIPRGEVDLRDYLAHVQADILVPQRDLNVVSARVRDYLLRTKPQWPGLGDAAQALHMSPSTLQRRLAAEGKTFQGVKDALRRDIAIMQLNTSEVSLPDLADELGFGEDTAFQRAFRSWTGSSPGVYRRGTA
jgi:AraC-like DNA-binding protein